MCDYTNNGARVRDGIKTTSQQLPTTERPTCDTCGWCVSICDCQFEDNSCRIDYCDRDEQEGKMGLCTTHYKVYGPRQ